MSADTGGIPQILKSAPQWLAWKYGERDGKTYINVWYIVSLIAGVVSRLCLLPAGTYYRIMRFQKILSLVLILLLITSVTVPTATASASALGQPLPRRYAGRVKTTSKKQNGECLHTYHSSFLNCLKSGES